jgi:hypothetical protein
MSEFWAVSLQMLSLKVPWLLPTYVGIAQKVASP